MGFFEDLGEGVEDAAKTVGKKVNEYGELAKLYAGVKSEELKIQEYYYKLGKEYYALCKDNADSNVIDKVNIINECNKKIDEYKVKIEEEKAKAKYSNL